jgi:hypothetical protein
VSSEDQSGGWTWSLCIRLAKGYRGSRLRNPQQRYFCRRKLNSLKDQISRLFCYTHSDFVAKCQLRTSLLISNLNKADTRNRSMAMVELRAGYCSFSYSFLASFRMGMSGSASFQGWRLVRFKRQADAAQQVLKARVIAKGIQLGVGGDPGRAVRALVEGFSQP